MSRESHSSTAKHTPGPWRVLNFSTGTKGFIAVVAHADRHVADVFPFGQRVAGTELAEHQANARLIAAAPDMLAALRVVTALTPDDVIALADVPDHVLEALEVCRRAIAKAEVEE